MLISFSFLLFMEYQEVMTDHSFNEKNSDRVPADLRFIMGSTCVLSERPEVETGFSITLKCIYQNSQDVFPLMF